MKGLVMLVLVALAAALCVPPVFAQATGTVKGVCRDFEGKPIMGATVEWFNTDNGRKYAIKTNSKGEYFSLGIDPGKYKVTLLQDGKQLDQANNFPVQVQENTLDFDLKKSQEQSAQKQGISPEKLKQMQEQQEKAAKEVNTVKALNDKLSAANEATNSQPPDFETAIRLLTEATQMDATRDVLWAKLGDVYRNSAVKQTDAAEKLRRLEAARGDYEKAVDLKQKAMEAGPKKPDDSKQLAAYYNNLGDAASKAGKVDDAVKAYTQAAQIDPANAGGYYFNIGAVLTNVGRADEALAAFDKAVSIDPTKAEAYYQKGLILMGKATIQGDKTIAPTGTAESFSKYLELQSTGEHAEVAKAMLANIGAKVETSFGEQKKKSTKK